MRRSEEVRPWRVAAWAMVSSMRDMAATSCSTLLSTLATCHGVFDAGHGGYQLLDLALNVDDLRVHRLDHVLLAVLLPHREGGLPGEPPVVLRGPHPVEDVPLLPRHLRLRLAPQVHQEEEVPPGVVLGAHVVVEADRLVEGEARQVADKAVCLEVRLVGLLCLPHAAKGVDDDTSDDGDEDEDEEEPVGDVPKDGKYEEVLPDERLDNVAGGVEFAENLLDAIVPDRKVQVRHEALEHVVAHFVVVLLAQQHHPQDHPDVHRKQPQQHGLHHLSQVEPDRVDDCLGP
mmetsp:Transcript_40293/g.100788  ORF Transcript_40293/g.100788 Transcript_40293/m.100788 type:complete len:288 (-) Transcript_40293:336-1199(-)